MGRGDYNTFDLGSDDSSTSSSILTVHTRLEPVADSGLGAEATFQTGVAFQVVSQRNEFAYEVPVMILSGLITII